MSNNFGGRLFNNTSGPKTSLTSKIWRGAIVLFIIIAFSVSSYIGDTNIAGYYKVKQAAGFGDLTVISDEGYFWQNFGFLTEYGSYGTVTLSDDEMDQKGASSVNDAVFVQFPDGDARVDVVFQYDMPTSDAQRLDLHRRYKSDKAVKHMIATQCIEAVKQTGPLMSTGEAYADSRSLFTQLAFEQLTKGIYAATVRMDTLIDPNTKEKTLVKKYSPKLGKDGLPIVMKGSLLAEYGIRISQFNIKDIAPDGKTLSLIDARKDAQLASERALKEKALGEELIAKEKANQEVAKIKEVTIAEKEKEVASLEAQKRFEVEKYNALTALEEAKKIRAQGDAEAAKNRALVSAGLVI